MRDGGARDGAPRRVFGESEIEIQGSLHCAADGGTVRCFGRDDVFFLIEKMFFFGREDVFCLTERMFFFGRDDVFFLIERMFFFGREDVSTSSTFLPRSR